MKAEDRYRCAKQATLVNASVNMLLAILKLVTGIFGRSAALVADGLHSLTDLITDALVIIAAKYGNNHPDIEHPYGHRRIETLATIGIACMLILVAFGIAWEAFWLLRHPAEQLMPSVAVIVIAAISIASNEFLFHYTLKKSKASNSQLLESNAWHNRTDALTSFVVLLSAIGARMGLKILDPIGAILIAMFIFYAGSKMVWRSVQELIDRGVDTPTKERILSHILNMPGVVDIHQLRTRTYGACVFLDAHVQVDSFITVSEGHYIAERVQSSLIEQISSVEDVTVHVDSENDETFLACIALPSRDTIEPAIRSAVESLPGGKEIQKIVLHYLGGKLYIEIYIPATTIGDKLTKNQLTSLYLSTVSSIVDFEVFRLYYY